MLCDRKQRRLAFLPALLRFAFVFLVLVMMPSYFLLDLHNAALGFIITPAMLVLHGPTYCEGVSFDSRHTLAS